VFEVGRCFLRSGRSYEQPLRIGGLAHGDAHAEQWGTPRRTIDFFDVKADLEALAAPHALATESAEHPLLHPGRSARVMLDGAASGWLGEMHPRLVKHFELPRAPILFEFELPPLLARKLPSARPVSKQPVVRRDLAVVVDESVPVRALLEALQVAGVHPVESAAVFDVYRGPGIAKGKKSLAILVLMQDTARTLTDAEIDAAVAQLLQILGDKFGATLRGQDQT
jgi:phenylalanyl-tRNA synthetase beta chain